MLWIEYIDGLEIEVCAAAVISDLEDLAVCTRL
jgi:hypothetical protein